MSALSLLKKITSLLAAAVITALALVYSLWGVDFAQLGSLLLGANFLALVPFAGFLILFFLFTGWRWNLILRPLGRFTLAQSGPAMMIGFAGNNVLPAHLGELVRAGVLGRQFAIPASSVLASLVVERLLDAFAIVFFYLVAVAAIDPFPESIRIGVGVVTVLMGIMFLSIIVFMRYPRWILAVYQALTSRLPAGWSQKGRTLLENGMTGMSALNSPSQLLQMMTLSLAKWLCGGGLVWTALWAFDTRISFGVGMIVIAVAALAVTVPSAPGYIGTMQAAFVFALLPFGISREVALAGSAFFLVGQWVPVTVLGGLCFAATGFRLREVRQEVERKEGWRNA